jgi:hypothetical protein
MRTVLNPSGMPTSVKKTSAATPNSKEVRSAS